MHTYRAPVVAATLIAVAVTATGCGDSEAEAETSRTMAGQLVAPECDGGWQIESSQVTLRNETNDIIGTATTSSNRTAPVGEPCVVDFEVADVPDAKFYTVTVGTHDGPAWSMADMEAQDFKPALTLGDAEVPTWEPEAFCADLDDLTDLFQDIDYLNEDPYVWTEEVRGYSKTLESYAAGIALEDDTDPDLLEGTLDAAQAIRKVAGYQSADRMNRALDPFNEAISDAHDAVDCAGIWTDQSYTDG